ncbi:MAG: hypothetical protein Q8N98_04525, partial [bacterium]|nr:hypothetical protein [bacterium]
AGTLAKIIAKTYPGAKIVGVEIDPVIVDIGKRFFGLSEIKNLKIVVANAASWIREIKSHNGFDLIAVDTYLGDKFPKSCQTDRFFKKLSQILSRNGFIIFNVLADKIHLFEARNFLDKTRKIFNDVRRIKVNKNWLISIHSPVD